MNKIVLEHYPAARLPDELRRDIPPEASVKVIIEEEDTRRATGTLEELVRRTRALQDAGRTVEVDDAVARIRTLRDEWDD